MTDPKKPMAQTEVLMEITRRYHVKKLREASNLPRPKRTAETANSEGFRLATQTEEGRR